MNTNTLNILTSLQNEGVTLYDVHTHPEEVLGIAKGDHCCSSDSAHIDISKPSLLEKLNFRSEALIVLRVLFRFFPNYISGEVLKKFTSHAGSSDIKTALNDAHITKAVIAPVPPHTPLTDFLGKYHKEERFILLGSIDIHALSKEDIPTFLSEQVTRFGIRGIKLHPNLQKFYPQPDRNQPGVAEKLVVLYETINTLKLFVLIHAGLSYTYTQQEPYEKVDFGLLEYFFSKDEITNKSFFKLITTPIIVAHLGCYNVLTPRFTLHKKILKESTNIFFDTAGISNQHIITFLRVTGKKGLSRLVFGSDALYFSMKDSAQKVLSALSRVLPEVTLRDKALMVFSQNFESKIL